MELLGMDMHAFLNDRYMYILTVCTLGTKSFDFEHPNRIIQCVVSYNMHVKMCG